MKVEASAPANIALIKYMGKTSAQTNIPTNSSLSYSADHLRSFVTIEPTDHEDKWAALEGLMPIELSTTGLEKFVSHFKRLKQHFNISGDYLIRSANNFPSDCGMASSASSFAALTLATSRLADAVNGGVPAELFELSKLSRWGSGSSCRSFFSPWAVWRNEGAEPIDIDWKLEHAAIVINDGKKPVTTSQAHLRVSSSQLFEGRALRAEIRMELLIAALRKREWQQCYELCWAEFWDMHALFETSQPHFGYMSAESLRVLSHLRQVWLDTGDGPVVTMDAGANVHIFLRPEQTQEADVWLKDFRSIKSWDSN